jgi:hypothetical protein
MAVSLSKATVCLIACHGGPADHFATYAETLIKQGYDVQIHATGPALKKFQDRNIEVKSAFSLDQLSPDEEDSLAQAIAKTCSTASIVITDVGHAFDVKIQQALSIYAAEIPRFAYYDNPEPFVPGGYSSTAAVVMHYAQGVLFANATLAKALIYGEVGKEVDFADKLRFGIGYYPVSQAEKIAGLRKSDHDTARSTFLMNNGIEDTGQKVLVYFGGNNEEYFSKAFPAFLSYLGQTDLKDAIIVLQQHPGAKVSNGDVQQVETWLLEYSQNKIIVSDFSSDAAQILADAALYHQTSMGPQFVLAGIPTVQIGYEIDELGHEIYEDILVRNQLAPTVTNSERFAAVIGNLEKLSEMPKQDLLNGLGIKEDWQDVLETTIEAIVGG